MNNGIEDTSSMHDVSKILVRFKSMERVWLPIKFAVTRLIGGSGAEDIVHNGFLMRLPLIKGGGFALCPKRSRKCMIACQADGSVEKWVCNSDMEQELITRWWFPEDAE